MKKCISFFIANRVIIVLLALFAITMSSQINPKLKRGDSPTFTMTQGAYEYTYIQPENPFLHMWSVWDTKWYISIAEDGYSTQTQPYTQTDNKGFLPVYPFLIYVVSNLFLFGNSHMAGILISNIFLILSFVYIRKLIHTEPKFKDSIHYTDVIMYLILFPTSYYLSSIYPESLFVLLSILVFYTVQKQKIFLACLFFSIAVITKTFGIFLCIPIAIYVIQHIKQISWSKLCAYAITASAIPLTYLGYMYYISGDAFAYIHIQEKFFRHEWQNPFITIFEGLFTFNNISNMWNSIFLFFTFLVGILACKKIPLSYTLFLFSSVLFTPLTGVLDGTSRYVASIFVLPIALAAIVKDQNEKAIIFMTFSLIQGCFILWWIVGAGFAS